MSIDAAIFTSREHPKCNWAAPLLKVSEFKEICGMWQVFEFVLKLCYLGEKTVEAQLP